MRKKLKHGHKVWTRFSGWGTVEMTCRLFQVAGVETGIAGAADKLVFEHVNAFDNSLVCQRALGLLPEECRPHSIFGDVEGLVSPSVRQDINAIQWPSTEDIKTNKLAALQRSVDAIVETTNLLGEDAFPKGLESWCHNKDAPCKIIRAREFQDYKGITECWMGFECIDYSRIGQVNIILRRYILHATLQISVRAASAHAWPRVVSHVPVYACPAFTSLMRCVANFPFRVVMPHGLFLR